MFDSKVLIDTYPDYMELPIKDWIKKILYGQNLIYKDIRYQEVIKNDFLSDIQTTFRGKFDSYLINFLNDIYLSKEKTSNILALCLQNYANRKEADALEWILSRCGSRYKVVEIEHHYSEHSKGGYDLVHRVNQIIEEEAQEAIDKDSYIKQAWINCYSRNPDYEKVVGECQDALESLLRDKYDPENVKPQIGLLLKKIQEKKIKLKYKGVGISDDKYLLLKLIENIAGYRGIHKAGTGRSPSKEQAEYFLSSTIYIWNLHNL